MGTECMEVSEISRKNQENEGGSLYIEKISHEK